MDALQKAWEEQQQRSIDRYRRQFPRNAFLIRQAAQALGETHRLLLDQINANQVDQIEHEVPFGPYEGRHTLELIQTPRSIALQGRIDRVDHIHAQDEDAVVVTDYKTGSRSFDPGDVFSGNYLQLPLYLSAAAGKQATPVGAFYLHVQSPEIRDLHEPAEEGDGHPDGFFVASERMAAFDASVAERTPGSRKKSAMEKDGALSEEEMDDFLEEAQQVARSLLQRREEGEIQAKPLYIPKKPKKSPCRYCEYRSLCHFDPMGQFGKQRFVASLSWKEWKDQRMKQRVSTPDSKGKEH